MTAPSEQDPTRGIVDINTFSLYVLGYRAAAIEYTLAVRSAPTIELTPLPDEEESHDFFHVAVEDYSWPEVPQSLRDVLALQYDQRSLDEATSINITIDKDRLHVRPNSPSIGLRLDALSETLVPPGGVTLFLTDVSRISRGQWLISREPLTNDYIDFLNAAKESGVMLNLNLQPTDEQLENLIETSSRHFDKIERIPISSTLQQLRDIARLLDTPSAKGKLKVARFNVNPKA